jgi:ABC-type sugar transport system substrate-binding protein
MTDHEHDDGFKPLDWSRLDRPLNRKQLLMGVGATGLTALLSACGSKSTTSSSSGGSSTTAGGSSALSAAPIKATTKSPADMKFRFMTQIDGVPYYQTVEKGAKNAGKDLGIGSVEVTGPPRVDSSLQVGTVQTWITQGVDVIAVSSTDPDAMTPVIDQAIGGGITVVSWDVDAPKSKRPIYVNGWDDSVGPKVLFDKFIEDLGGPSKGKGQYAFILPSLTSVTHKAWCQTMLDYQKQKFPQMKLVAQEGCDADQTIGNQKAKQLKSKYPNLVGIVSVDAGGTVGIAQATKELNLVGKFANTGLSTPGQMKAFLKSGVTKHTVLWDPEVTGYLTTVIAHQLLTGKTVTDGMELAVGTGKTRKIKLVRAKGALQAIQGDPLVFTKDNVDQFSF